MASGHGKNNQNSEERRVDLPEQPFHERLNEERPQQDQLQQNNFEQHVQNRRLRIANVNNINIGMQNAVFGFRIDLD